VRITRLTREGKKVGEERERVSGRGEGRCRLAYGDRRRTKGGKRMSFALRKRKGLSDLSGKGT